MFRFSFYPVFGSYGFVLALTILFAFVLLAVRPGGDRLTERGRRCLLLLRIVSLLLFCFALLRPTLVYTKTERLASTLNILLDQSESMSRPDELGGNTRFQIAKESLLSSQPQLRKLQQDSEVDCYVFDASLQPVTVSDGLLNDLPAEPKGKETAIGAVLDAIRERSSGKRVLGTVLLTDGNQRARPPRDVLPHDAAVRLRDAGMPLYAVRLGQAGGTTDVQDISVNDLQANDRVFVRNNLQISGSIRITGYRNQPIPVQLLFEDERGRMRVVDEQTVRCTEEGQIVSYRFSYAPMETGYFKYTVLVPPQPKELIDTNNQQSNFVRVIDGGLNVLYLQGERQQDQRFLRQSLDASADIQVVYRPLRVGRIKAVSEGFQTFQQRLERFTEERPSWLEEFQPDKYNVYMLGDLDAKAFKPEELQALAQRVREGSGLIMLGGFHAFGAGGYADTPLADVCPVELRSVERQSLDGPIRRDIHWMDPIRMLPKETGNRVPYVMQLTRKIDENKARWEAMPPLLGANRFDKIKPGATVFAEGPAGERLLVSQLYGLGRVLAFAGGDSTYRWRLAGFVEEHKQFWRQVILWLARMDGILLGDCWVTVDNFRLLPGEPVRFQVFGRSPDGEEMKHFKAEAFISRPTGAEQPVSLVDQDGVPTGTFRETTQPGDYTIRVVIPPDPDAPDGGPRSTTARFMVFDRNLELDSPVAFPKLLENLSVITGGRSVAPEQLPTLLEELSKQSDELVEKRETQKTLYDDWRLLLAFVCCLSLEWFLRKRWGLV